MSIYNSESFFDLLVSSAAVTIVLRPVENMSSFWFLYAIMVCRSRGLSSITESSPLKTDRDLLDLVVFWDLIDLMVLKSNAALLTLLWSSLSGLFWAMWQNSSKLIFPFMLISMALKTCLIWSSETYAFILIVPSRNLLSVISPVLSTSNDLKACLKVKNRFYILESISKTQGFTSSGNVSPLYVSGGSFEFGVLCSIFYRFFAFNLSGDFSL